MATKTNDVIMEAIVREVKRSLRKETSEKVRNLVAVNADLTKKVKKLQRLERAFKTESKQICTERSRIRTLATKIIKEYDFMINLKKKSIGSIMYNNDDWRIVSRQRAAVVTLRKLATKP